jgi:glycosyltransferase involved in cell wall biosynthesis
VARIGIDLTALLPQATGVDQILLNLVRHLGRLDGANRYVLFVNVGDRPRFGDSLGPNFRLVPVCLRPRPFRLAFQQALLPAVATALALDVLHSPAFIMPLWRGRTRHVLTVHDMTFFSLPDCHIPLRRSRPFRRAVVHSIRHADLVCVPSHHVRRDLLERVSGVPEGRIRVVGWGVGEEFRPHPADAARAVARRLGIAVPYILHVGTIEPRKNLDHLVESYRRLVGARAVDEHLVLAGRLGWSYDDLLARLAAPELRDRVHLVGYVGQEDLPLLYAGARLCVYPSLEEGFGLPPLEAMACGVPTVSSRSSALAENLEGAAELVPPGDVDALVAAMARLLRDEALRATRVRHGLERAAAFRWAETARAMVGCYEELAAAASGAHRRC